MQFGRRKCPQCGVRSPRKDWWRKIQPVAEHATGTEGSAGVSTANVVDYGWTRSTYRSRSVLITCPQCGHTVTVRDRKSQGFW